jgi:hypothetical protein
VPVQRQGVVDPRSRGGDGHEPDLGNHDDTNAPSGVILGVDSTLGPYQLEEVLGEGGMGTVYRARQEVPIRRDVAIKVIKAGLYSAEAGARFAAEVRLYERLERRRARNPSVSASALERRRPFDLARRGGAGPHPVSGVAEP